MISIKEEIGKFIFRIFDELGIDPIYGGTTFILLITLSYWQEFKEWDRTPEWKRWIILSTAFGCIVAVLISLLRLIGVIKF